MSLYILEDIDWLKGIVSRYEYFLRLLKLITFCACADGVYNFCFLVDEIIRLKVLACFFEIT
jgi:hypothetical protein